MSQPRVFTWPAASTNAICLSQSIFGAADLILNGALVVPISANPQTIASTLHAPFPGITRTVSLTSANDLSLVNFTIRGTYYGIDISETIAGPNNDTVYTTYQFDSVTYVHGSAAAAAVSIGTGTTGQTKWNLVNYNQSGGGGATFGIQVIVSGTINYSYLDTLDDVNYAIQHDLPITSFRTIADLTSKTASAYVAYSGYARYQAVDVNSSTDGSLVITLAQQGIV